jgi:hypothetical protein
MLCPCRAVGTGYHLAVSFPNSEMGILSPSGTGMKLSGEYVPDVAMLHCPITRRDGGFVPELLKRTLPWSRVSLPPHWPTPFALAPRALGAVPSLDFGPVATALCSSKDCLSHQHLNDQSWYSAQIAPPCPPHLVLAPPQDQSTDQVPWNPKRAGEAPGGCHL